MIEEQTTYIYALRDPETEEICYVGCSTNPLWRLEKHLTDRNYLAETAKADWIQDLDRRGLIPALEILDQVSLETWREDEAAWISWMWRQGHPLTNQNIPHERVAFLAGERATFLFLVTMGRDMLPRLGRAAQRQGTTRGAVIREATVRVLQEMGL